MADLYVDDTTRLLALIALKKMFVGQGCQRLFFKRLAANDNSKNQLYLGGSPEDTRPVRTGHWSRVPGASAKGTPSRLRYILQAPVNLHWLKTDGQVSAATQSKLILYPQYGAAGEYRLSGFLEGAADRPGTLLNVAKRGR